MDTKYCGIAAICFTEHAAMIHFNHININLHSTIFAG